MGTVQIRFNFKGKRSLPCYLNFLKQNLEHFFSIFQGRKASIIMHTSSEHPFGCVKKYCVWLTFSVLFTSKSSASPPRFSHLRFSRRRLVHGVHDVAELRVDGTSGQIRMIDWFIKKGAEVSCWRNSLKWHHITRKVQQISKKHSEKNNVYHGIQGRFTTLQVALWPVS